VQATLTLQDTATSCFSNVLSEHHFKADTAAGRLQLVPHSIGGFKRTEPLLESAGAQLQGVISNSIPHRGRAFQAQAAATQTSDITVSVRASNMF